MIKHVLKLGALLLIGILGYNYFFGTATEKANSQKIFGQVKEVAVSVKNLVKNEKTKFDAGKYDKALQKLGGAYKGIREKLGGIDKKLLDRIDHLDDRKAKLQKEIQQVEKTGDVDKQNELQEKLTKLVEDTEKVINSIKQE